MSVEVRKVASKAEFKVFFEFPWHHYQNEPHWIPELPSMRRSLISKEKGAAWEYLIGDHFVAYQDGQPVGVISAFVNPLHNEFHQENIGFFGFFECINDQHVANALFGAACDFLREQGVDAIRGPVNPTMHETNGILVKGFEYDPMVLMPYNYAYYNDLFCAAGFEKAMNLTAWKLDLVGMRETDYGKRLKKLAERAQRSRNLTFRKMRTFQKGKDLTLLKEMYNIFWQDNWGFVPMTGREKDEMVENLGLLVGRDDLILAYSEDELVGFVLLAPNFAEALKHVQARPGRPELWWLLKVLWHWKVRSKISSVRLTLVGIKQEYRNAGVISVILDAALDAVAEKYTWTECSWLLETNPEALKMLQHAGFTDYKHYRIYQKSL